MITTYLDKGCKVLNSSQKLKLREDCSAYWFCVERGSDTSRLFRFMVSTFESFDSYFWLAFSGGTGTPKMLDAKRSFGHWAISKKEVASKHDAVDESGSKLYSDIVQVNAGNLNTLAQVADRSLFGIDSTVFFLPAGATLTSNDVAKPLVDLLVKRNAMDTIDERDLNQGFVESFVEEIIKIDGFATVTLRDSNMGILISVVGNQTALSRIAKSIGSEQLLEDCRHVNSEGEFIQLLNVGVSVSVFS